MNGEGGAGRNRKRVPRVVAIIRSSAVQITLCFSLHDFVSSKVDFPGRETNHKPKNVVQILRQTRLYVLLPMRFISFFLHKKCHGLEQNPGACDGLCHSFFIPGACSPTPTTPILETIKRRHVKLSTIESVGNVQGRARRTLHGGSRLFFSQKTHSRYSSYQKSDSTYGGLNLMVYYSTPPGTLYRWP